MKNILYILLFISSVGYSQTPITDANFDAAISDCLSTHPVTGLCVDSEYGPMPDWDVSNVTNMAEAFLFRPDFNSDIGDWDVSNVNNMLAMFFDAQAFNQDIGGWDVSNVTVMKQMFDSATSFNQDIGTWDVSNVTNMESMFTDTDSFNQDIGDWDVANVTYMGIMFYRASSFNQDIGDWDVSNVIDMIGMFNDSDLNTCNYDNTLQGWSTLDLTPNVTLGANGISYCSSETERQSIIDNFGWTVDDGGLNCTDECLVCPFTDSNIQAAVDLWISDPTAAEVIYGNISDWNTSCVTNMSQLFKDYTAFNDDISQWDVQFVSNMSEMFNGATSFNQNIGGWTVNSVNTMLEMFNGATSFNQYIGEWDVSNVTTMGQMFNEATSFNQDIGDWDVSNVIDMIGMFNDSDLNTCNYDNTLRGWSTQDLTPNVTLSASGITYCDSETERQSIIDNFGWTINGDELNCTDVCITTARVIITDFMNITPRATAPSFPSKGDIYMNSITNKLMVYDGTTWRACW